MTGASDTDTRSGYHHGNLRDHLIDATRKLIKRAGLEAFKVADACRCAGVSSAAPYRHFADRKELLEAVAIAGFNDLRDQLNSAGEQHCKGSVDAVSAIGRAYVAFASREPNLFRLMFGQGVSTASSESGVVSDNGKNGDNENSACQRAGRECYDVLLNQLLATLGCEHIDDKVVGAAFPLWTFVHGLSFLVIDGNLSVNQMPVDIHRQIDLATARLMPIVN